MRRRVMVAAVVMAGALGAVPVAHAAGPSRSSSLGGRVIVVQCTGAGYAAQVVTPRLPVPSLNLSMGPSPCHVKSCFSSGGRLFWFGSWRKAFPPVC